MDRNPSETARKISDEALSRLATDLKAGRSAALTDLLGAMVRFRRYSWDNALLISAQRPDANRVATMHAWKDLGRMVQEGEKGILIFSAAGEKKEPPLSPAPVFDDRSTRGGHRPMYVYDVSQTEGKALPELARPTARIWEYGDRLRDLVAKRGIALEVDRTIETARGVSSGGKIRISPGLSPIQYVSVLAHELTHEILHHRPEAAGISRDAIEAQAYGVAYVVARGLGIETPPAAAEYMAAYAADHSALAQTLAVIHETSAKILHQLIRDERAERRTPATREDRFFLDAERFGNIHRQYRDRLVYSMTEFVRNHAKAEDIAAQAFRVAWAKREQFRGHALPYTWLQAIARNAARRTLNRDQILRFEPIDGEEARQSPAPELVTDDLEKRDDRLQLQKALERLPIKHRRALIAHFVDSLSIREIARRERVPVGTVLSRIHKGKQLLRQAWETPITTLHPDAAERRASLRSPEGRPESGRQEQTYDQ